MKKEFAANKVIKLIIVVVVSLLGGGGFPVWVRQCIGLYYVIVPAGIAMRFRSSLALLWSHYHAESCFGGAYLRIELKQGSTEVRRFAGGLLQMGVNHEIMDGLGIGNVA